MISFERQCPHCDKRFVPDLASQDGFRDKFMRWTRGELIQHVWPEATSIQREQLMTGFCSDKCWNAFFGREE